MKLIHNNGYTQTYGVLAYAACRGGVTPTRRQKGWSDWNIFSYLLGRGWIEARNTGPRGGRSYYATRKGRYHLRKARLSMEVLEMAVMEATFVCNRPFGVHVAVRHAIPKGIDPSNVLAVVRWFGRVHPAEYLAQRTLYRLGVR
jgi:hypothetical protein